MSNDNVPKWKYRRIAIFSSLVFAMIIISKVAFSNDDSRIGETLVLSAFGLMGAIIAAYIGGAAYEDVRRQVSESQDVQSYDDHNDGTIVYDQYDPNERI